MTISRIGMQITEELTTPMTQQSAECQAATDAAKERLDAHFKEAEDSADDNGKFNLGFCMTFDRSHSPTKIKVTCRVTTTITDEPSGAR